MKNAQPAASSPKSLIPDPRFTKFALYILLFNLLVIVWGGLVSASGSGDGCGASWPLCQQIAASEGGISIETIIEFSHRVTSGLALLGVAYMAFWARRLYPAKARARKFALYALIFMVVESLLGAGLVIFHWVDTNMSLARAFVQPIHLINTFLLMASIGLTYWYAAGNRLPNPARERKAVALLAIGLFGVVVVSSFGAIASLATTIFPSESFFEGVQKDFSRDVHYLIRLRIWHPFFAAIVGFYLMWLRNQWEKQFGEPLLNRALNVLIIIFWTQFAMGGLNAIWLAPLWLQLLHLLGAHLLWLSFVFTGAIIVGLLAPNAGISTPQLAKL